MEAIDGQEVQFPVVLPASLWEESGRYGRVGSELLRFSDRNKSPMVLGMTHEEAVQLVREYGQSYSRYPFMIYQIQTKFRDGGQAPGRPHPCTEFTMKDAILSHLAAGPGAILRALLQCLRAYLCPHRDSRSSLGRLRFRHDGR